MVLFIDIEKQIVQLYGDKGVIEVPFTKVNTLYSHIKDKKVYYVTQAVEAEVNDVVNLVCSITGSEVPQPPKPKVEIPDNGQRYIHYNSNGSMIISDIGLSLKGKFDIKPLDTDMQKLITRSSMLQNFLKNGKVVVIDNQRKRELEVERKIWQQQEDKKQKMADEALDSMIVDRRTMEAGGSLSMSMASGHDAEVLDIDGPDEAGLMPHERGASSL